MRNKILFSLALLVTLLLLPACNQEAAPVQADNTPILAFHIDPEQGLVSQADFGTLPNATTLTDGQQLVNDLLNLDSMNYWFEGDKLYIESVFTNISADNLWQPFTFEPNPATSNIVSSVEPTVTDADLGGDGILSPGEATSVLRFEVIHRYQPFTYMVDAYAITIPVTDQPLWTWTQQFGSNGPPDYAHG